MPAALFLAIKKRSGFNTNTETLLQSLSSVLWKGSSSRVFSRHADFMLAVRPRLSSAHKQLTSCFGAGSVSDKERHCGLHSELPAGINHCQDAPNPLKVPFSWLLGITSCKSSKEKDVPNKELYWLLSFPKTSPTGAPEDVKREW